MTPRLVAPHAEAEYAAPPPDGPSTPRDAGRVQRVAAARARRLVHRRRRRDRTMRAMAAGTALVAVLPLVLILAHLVARGASALSPAFFVQPPAPVGAPGGGMANGITGTLLLLAIGGALGVPLGVGAGLWLAERRGTRAAAVLGYLADVMIGVPSIVFGIVAWQLLVRPAGHFSAWAGGAALGALVVPIVARTTESVVALVPVTLAESALALGYAQWRVRLGVVLPAALPGVVTGALLALARVAGETAPLLFTAFGNQFWSVRADAPIAALPLQVYAYATSAFDAWRAQAYAGALVLVAIVAAFGLLARATIGPRGVRGARVGARRGARRG